MEHASLPTIAGLCLGIALSGLLAVMFRHGAAYERLSLGLVYVAFIAMIALPIIQTFARGFVIHYMPLLLVMLLVLPAAFYHYVFAKTASTASVRIPWRDLALPVVGGIVAIGFWALPSAAKETMFLEGELPTGLWPAALALATFALIMIWLVASFAYLVAILRRLAAYRTHIRQLYSDADERDLRWVDVLMGLLVVIWALGAVSLAEDNLGRGNLFVEEIFLALIGGGLLILNILAPVTSPKAKDADEEPEPDLKYARSALTRDHAAKLADRIETAMRKDELYLDPSLSLQKLSQQVGAVPNQVSQTLNQEIGETFFDYVSRWRIEASKPLVSAGDDSVLTVALAVGFNSRSTFYKAFKRETGLTPKGYRAAQQTMG